MTYRVYVSDSLYHMGQGKTLTVKYLDIVYPTPEETRTSEEIITHMKSKLKGLVNN